MSAADSRGQHSEVIENILTTASSTWTRCAAWRQGDYFGKTAYIEGVPQLRGAPVIATDLRGGRAGNRRAYGYRRD